MIVKSLKDISWKVTEAEYRQDAALSYSTLSRFEREGFSKLNSLFDRVATPSLTFGSIVDALITGTLSEFEDNFYIMDDIGDISETQKSIVATLFDIHKDAKSLVSITNEEILDTCKQFNYGNNWKDITKINLIRTNGTKYFKALRESDGKTAITMDEYLLAKKCVDSLKESDTTKFFFFDNPFDESNDYIERLYQLKFKGEDPDLHIPYRCMLDLIVVDHKNKTIQPVDLKTSSHFEYEFPESFIQWEYQIQARLYYRILEQNVLKDPYFKDFKILDYKFIVINKNSRIPLVWDFEKTKTIGNLQLQGGKSHKDFTLRDPYVIGNELSEYLKSTPIVPNGINIGEGKSNSIENWIKECG